MAAGLELSRCLDLVDQVVDIGLDDLDVFMIIDSGLPVGRLNILS